PTKGDPWKLVSGTPTEPPTTEPEPPVTEPEPPVTEPEPPVTEPEPPVTGNFIQWEPGVTQVANGDKVTYQNKCFVAKNGPGVWESPTQSNWFWDEISCQ
ncbi:carbohydrate-binding protein, partial [Vibrio parahaemolyticus]|nr:carbohydrate-binding protein [Vibrio parahaemolyticus]